MRTALDIKRALDPDTMLNIVREGEAERCLARKQKEIEIMKLKQSQRKKILVWQEIFPACVCK